MRIRVASRGFALAWAIVAISIDVQAANLLTPNGNPTGPALAVGTAGTSALNVNPASYRVAGDCPWVVPALNAEGFNAANGWTINTVALTGNDITLGTYLDYADVQPAITQGAVQFCRGSVVERLRRRRTWFGLRAL
jgi:hypothetical protein